jgi:hypothetical protein
MDKRLLTAVFIAGIFCVVSFSGCVSQPSEPQKIIDGITAKDALDRSFAASAAAGTYSYKMTMRASLPNNVSSGVAMDVMSVYGIVDKVNKKTYLSTVMNQLQSAQNTETYIIGSTYYGRLPTGEWIRQETANDQLWQQQSVQGMQEELANYSTVAFLPGEKIDGVNCYVLNITPDKNKLPSLLGKNANLQEQTVNSIVSASIKEWVDKDSFLMKRIVFQIDMEDNGKIIRMETELVFSDYGKEQSIVLPADAKNAKALQQQTPKRPSDEEIRNL